MWTQHSITLPVGLTMKSRQPKRRRTERGSARRIEMTPRDDELLLLTGMCGHIGTDQICRALFTSEDRCRRRVRSLYDAGYLATLLVSSREPSLVRLTNKGLAYVTEKFPEAASRIRLPGPIRLAGIAHRRCVVDTRLYLAALAEQRGTPLIRWSNAGGELGAELGLTDLHLVPDGIAVLATPELVYVSIEIDRTTESLGILSKKIERYVAAAAAGRLDSLWLIITGGSVRYQNLSRLLSEAGLGDWARVIPYSHILTRPVRELPEREDAGQTRSRAQSPEYASLPPR